MEQTAISTSVGYEYRHKNGEVHRASDVYEAIGRCAFLGDMEQSEAELALELYAIGSNKITGDSLTLADDEQGELVLETLELETVDTQQSHRVDSARENSVEIINSKPGDIKSDSNEEAITAELTDMNHGPSGAEQGSGSAVKSGGRTIEISSTAQDRSDPPAILILADKKLPDEAYGSTHSQLKEADAITRVAVTRPEGVLPIAKPVLFDEYQPSKVQETLIPVKKDEAFITPEPIIFETKITDKYEVEFKPVLNKLEADAPDNGLDILGLEQQPNTYKESSQTAISGTTNAESNTPEHSEILVAAEESPAATENLEELQLSDLEVSGEIIEFEPTRPDHLNIELAETPISSPVEIAGFTQEETFRIDPELNVPLVQVEATVAMVADRIDALAPKRLIEVNQILDGITEIMRQATRHPLVEAADEKVIIKDVEIEEQVKEKFIMLLNTLGIDHTPELAESLAKLTLSTNFVELISKINLEQPDDPMSGNKGTHEIIQKLILAANNVKKLGIYAYQMGKLALRLYSRKGMITYA